MDIFLNKLVPCVVDHKQTFLTNTLAYQRNRKLLIRNVFIVQAPRTALSIISNEIGTPSRTLTLYQIDSYAECRSGECHYGNSRGASRCRSTVRHGRRRDDLQQQLQVLSQLT
jgi:hypothetical protein